MQKSKDIFLETIQDNQLHYDSTFTKKEAKTAGKNAAYQIIDEGNVDLFEALGNVARLKEVIISLESELKKADVFDAMDKNRHMNGIDFSCSNTGDRLDYEKDEAYSELSTKLKSRQELLKLAWKSKDEIYDQDGVQVPKVGIKTHGKQIIKLNF